MTAPRRVTGPASYARLREQQRDARYRALEAVSRMRRGQTLTAAARDAGTTPATVRRYAGDALERSGPRWSATASDRIYRRMVVLSVDGPAEVDVRSSARASRVAAHYNAIDHYLRTGDTKQLRRFRNVRVGGQLLQTDIDAIELHVRAGELRIEDIYPHR